MNRRSTIRLPVAVLITAAGALVAILWGRADAALLTVPWVVLLVVGLSGARRQAVSGSVSCDTTRVVTGDPVTVTARISGASGWLVAICRPAAEFRVDYSDSGEDGDNETEGGDGGGAGPAEQTGDEPFPGTADLADLEREDEVTALSDVADRDRITQLAFTLRTSAWGSHDVGRVDLEITEPYGLLRWSGSLHVPNEIRVHPRPIDLQRLLAPLYVRRLSGAHRSRSTGRGVEYADVRPFTSGDSLRDINWRASARSDELWVSQRHPERSTDAVLLLDTFIESGHDLRASLGLAIEAAIGLAESHLTVSDRVGLIELGGILRWVTPGTGRHQLQRLADALLATRLYENASDRYVLAVPPRALPPRSFIVALSPLLDDRFIDALGVLRASGHDVSVIECPPFIDPVAGSLQKEQQQHAKHQEEAELADSARVAQRLWTLERSMTRDRLIEQGIAVGRWELGESLDPVLAGLAAHRDGMRARAVGLRAGHG